MMLKADVALFGTFDVANYGDLLFPHVVAHSLGCSLGALRCYSPRGGAPAWDDAHPALPVAEYRRHPPPALCLIGGGNIIHANPTPLADYQAAFSDPQFVYSSLWLGASLLAAETGARLVWNAPGVPHPIEGAWVRRLRDLALAAADYVSVRDEASRVFLGSLGRAHVVPDPALKLASVWPRDELASYARSGFESRGMAMPERWVALHLNDRYLEPSLAAACQCVSEIAATLDAVPVLISIGPCHQDDALARQAAALIDRPTLLVDRPRGLKEIAALIAHAQAYVGSSMHGLVTALAYRRPGIAVARTRMVKFLGLLEQLGEPDRLQENWQDAARMTRELLQPLSSNTCARLDAAEALIADHGRRLRQILASDPAAEKIANRAALRSAVNAASPAFPIWRRLSREVLGDLTLFDEPGPEADEIAVALRKPFGDSLGRRIAAATKQWPDNLRLALLQAEWLERTGNIMEAQQRLMDLREIHATNPWPLVRLIRLLVASGDKARAHHLYHGPLQTMTVPDSTNRELRNLVASPNTKTELGLGA